MKRGVTLKDLAKELGLSVSAVSKALRNDPGISSSTTARLRQLAEERNYVPNLAAIRLKQSRNFKIVIIIPGLFDQFYGLALCGIKTRQRATSTPLCLPKPTSSPTANVP